MVIGLDKSVPLEQPQKLMTIFACARPVLFANDDPNFPASVTGTSFVLMFRGRHFVVSAKHVMRGFQPGQVRIQYRPDSARFIPLRNRYQFHCNDSADDDQFDVVVWDVDGGIRPELFGHYQPYLLGTDDVWPWPHAEERRSDYLYRGYPRIHRRIDFDVQPVREYGLDSVTGRGNYIGPASIEAVHTVELVLLDEHLPSEDGLDGMSGSPVFQVVLLEENYSTAIFAGMFLRGSRVARRAHFLQQQRIVDILTAISVGRVAPAT
jgi:hypothetical protein